MLHFGMEVIGIHNGFKGLLEKDVQVFNERSLSGILNLGGTILGTSREKPFRKQLQASESDKPQVILDNYRQLGLDALVCIGGNGTQKTANLLANIGLNVVGVPKTIDNDIWGTDITFGFDTAVNIATESIDRLHSTASSHKRVMVVEVMGHHAGWIALYAGMAGAADVILMPELAYDMGSPGEALFDRGGGRGPQDARQGSPFGLYHRGDREGHGLGDPRHGVGLYAARGKSFAFRPQLGHSLRCLCGRDDRPGCVRSDGLLEGWTRRVCPPAGGGWQAEARHARS